MAVMTDGLGVFAGPWNEVQEHLVSEGYEPGYTHNPAALIDGLAIDQEVAETTACEACGAKRGRFEAWRNTLTGGCGVAVAICQACGHAVTF